ncbi:MAG: hypothetical protein JWP03_4230 [Phycisphaerales bacterium]|nr:hypothetical protein [Phycisphaerales bacterium]
MSDLLFDVPWWIPTLLAVIGIALMFRGNAQQKSNVRTAGLAVFALAVGWFLLSYLIDTDKEKAQKGTKLLLQAVVDQNWTKFQSMLTPQASVTVQGQPTGVTGAENVRTMAQTGAEAIHLTGASMRSSEAEQDGSLIQIQAQVVSIEEFPQAPTMPSTWQFIWENTPAGWRVREIRLIKLGDLRPEDMKQLMPKGR